MKVPFLDLTHQNQLVKAEVSAALHQVMDRDWYINGEALQQFEMDYAQFNQTKYVIGTGNGLDALRIALMTLEIGAGDEVIVPSNTFIATWLAVSSVGATIVPVEPDPATSNIDPNKIRAAITENTKAIIPVHLYGQVCNMTAIVKMAEEHELHVIEDNAQAQGALHNGKLTGTFGILNATSFYPGKNIGAMGDGGALTTDDEAYSKRARMIGNYGSSVKYHHDLIGINSRLDEFQAAVVKAKLPHVKAWNELRRSIARQYMDALKDCSAVRLPQLVQPEGHVFHLFVIHVDDRDGLQAHLAEDGIQTIIHYPIPPHLQKAYSDLGYKKGDFPIAEKLAQECLSLPLFPGMSEEQVEHVTGSILRFYSH